MKTLCNTQHTGNSDNQASSDAQQISLMSQSRTNLQENSKNKKSTLSYNDDTTGKDIFESTNSIHSDFINTDLALDSFLQTSTHFEDDTHSFLQGLISKEERKVDPTETLTEQNYDMDIESDEGSEKILPEFNESEIDILCKCNELLCEACNDKENQFLEADQDSSMEDLTQVSLLEDQLKRYEGDVFQYRCCGVKMQFLWILVVQLVLVILQYEPIRARLNFVFSSDFKKKLEEVYTNLMSRLPGWVLRSKVLEKTQERWNAFFQDEVPKIQGNVQPDAISNKTSYSPDKHQERVFSFFESERTTTVENLSIGVVNDDFSDNSPKKKSQQSKLKNKKAQVMEKARGIIDDILHFSAEEIQAIRAEYYKSDQEWIEDITAQDAKRASLKNKKYCAFFRLHKFAKQILKCNSDVLENFNKTYKRSISENFFRESYLEEDDLFSLGVILQVSLGILPKGESPTEIIDEITYKVQRNTVYFAEWIQKGRLNENNRTVFKDPKNILKIRNQLKECLEIVEKRLQNSEKLEILQKIWRTLSPPFTITRPTFRTTMRKPPGLVQNIEDELFGDTGKRAGQELEMIKGDTKKVNTIRKNPEVEDKKVPSM